MTTKRNAFERSAPQSSLNWYANDAARIVYANFSF